MMSGGVQFEFRLCNLWPVMENIRKDVASGVLKTSKRTNEWREAARKFGIEEKNLSNCADKLEKFFKSAWGSLEHGAAGGGSGGRAGGGGGSAAAGDSLSYSQEPRGSILSSNPPRERLREKDRDDRDRERERDTRERDQATDQAKDKRDWDRDGGQDRNRDRERDRDAERASDGDRNRDRDRGRDKDRDSQRGAAGFGGG
eukprot:CAMPEP_0179445594 /NCGR_PEP_ID=MMETSP0799-20121207/29013_1 /TAXON_ID=46947 /ORGANISM="Geminigera cryophila, Strain CCMP2564" /LENGTH=200 /DNA_ID=CAMNT_0021233739 /DNA_START=67 /DNA_END=665 /DNA_ORIENTATION=-